MANVAELEKELLQLNPSERARVAMAAWESLAEDPISEADPALDPDGITLAKDRDHQLDSGLGSVDLEEFRRQTGG